MAEPNKGQLVRKAWPKEIRQQAKDLYGQGQTVEEISDTTGIPLSTITSWRYRDKWKAYQIALTTDAELEIFENSVSAITEAKKQLLKGYQLIAKVGEDGVQDDELRFRDKKQAIDAVVTGLQGQVEIRGAEISREFLIDIARIIKDEVPDAITRQRIGEKLVALGRLYNSRTVAN
ncbi:hypothetical protein CMI37_07930 [Candidatus Pacearchaeota archaeon]|nr:hypothetical protein [Candidatus Pacearchaeota archaeon]|tara:strand:- start:4075 stop:4602 length:528 start_codon:yes stop_codon:yes gene_type:complete